ncbi:MAG: hypothetical protein AB8G99_10980 [Planctomycetaceae bacterium]
MQALATTEWTWVLHSTLLIAAVFGRFTKIWSVRNLDVLLLIGLTPALLLYSDQPWILYSISVVLAVRLIFDTLFRRRPRIDPNLNVYGMSFLCITAFIVLVARVFAVEPEVQIAEQADKVLHRTVSEENDADPTTTLVASPALALSKNIDEGRHAEELAMQIVAVTAHAFVVLGLLTLGYKHFSSWTLGIAMASLYLLLPCTAFYVHRVNHAVPAAFLIWAFVFYKRPLVVGSLMAFASGALFSTVFLVPLWSVFYGRKRFLRFGTGLAAVGVILTLPLLLTSLPGTLTQKLHASMNWSLVNALQFDAYKSADTIQELLRPHFAVVFFCVFVTLTIWPRKKELNHLIAHSTGLVVLAQLWYPERPGVYVLWYLPLLLLVVFRPRLRHLTEEATDAAQATRLAPRPEKTVPARATVATSPLRR